MTKEQIEQAANEFVNSDKYAKMKGYPPKVWFIAGAEFRQKEIDELVKFLKHIALYNPLSIDKEFNYLLKKYENE
jgi:hypothetical protein